MAESTQTKAKVQRASSNGQGRSDALVFERSSLTRDWPNRYRSLAFPCRGWDRSCARMKERRCAGLVAASRSSPTLAARTSSMDVLPPHLRLSAPLCANKFSGPILLSSVQGASAFIFAASMSGVLTFAEAHDWYPEDGCRAMDCAPVESWAFSQIAQSGGCRTSR